MNAWERVRAWPVWVTVPTAAVVGLSALGLGWMLGDLVPVDKKHSVRPITALASTTTSAVLGGTDVTGGTTVPTSSPRSGGPTTTATTTGPAPVRGTDPVLVRVVCDAVALEVVGRVLTGPEAAEALRVRQEQERTGQRQAASDAAALDSFCRDWIRTLPAGPGKPVATTRVSSTN